MYYVFHLETALNNTTQSSRQTLRRSETNEVICIMNAFDIWVQAIF